MKNIRNLCSDVFVVEGKWFDSEMSILVTRMEVIGDIAAIIACDRASINRCTGSEAVSMK